MLINYTLNREDSDDKTTNTLTAKNADKSPSNGTRFQTFSEIGRDMETQLGEAVKFHVSHGLVELFSYKITCDHHPGGRKTNFSFALNSLT